MDEYKIDLTVEKVLRKAYNMENRTRNKILFWAITVVVTASFCFMSMICARIQADAFNNMRADGRTVSAYLENGTEISLKQLKNLPYVKNTGLKKNVGKIMDGQRVLCSCILLDTSAYEQMIAPTFTDIQGTYPQKADEIMLSRKTLDAMGIKIPQAGMKLSVEFYWNDISCQALTGRQDFTLSGYYTDMRDTAIGEQEAYISKTRLEACSVELFPCQILIDMGKSYLNGSKTEEIFYRDLAMEENQQMISVDSAFYRAVEKTAGGYGAALTVFLAFVLILFLFVYNVLYLSMGKDIRQYGLLRVLGVSEWMIKKMVYIQMLQICLSGNVAGIFFSFVITGAVLFKKIDKMFLFNGETMNKFYAVLLPVICLLVFMAVFLMNHILLKRILDFQPIQAAKYENADRMPDRRRLSQKKRYRKERYIHPILQIAWMNIMRSKKKFFLVVCSLVLGCETALVSAVIGNGTDGMNELEQNPDFEISMTHEFCVAQMESFQENDCFLKDSRISQIEDMACIRAEDISKTEGFFPIIDKEGRESFQVLNMLEDPVIIIQKLDAREAERLKPYMEKQENVDLDTFLNQNGVLILHRHLLPETSEKESEKYIGTSIGIYDLVPVGTDMSGYSPVSLVNCGYLDMTDRAFPELNPLWNGEKTICMAVSEDTFKELGRYLIPQTFRVFFDVEKDKEPEIKNVLKQWIQKTNRKSRDVLSITCNSDRIAEEQNAILATRFVMWMVSLIFIFLGVMNYLNIMLTDFMTRSREFAVMRNIGLTERQLNWMLILEGLLFGFITAGILGTFGSGILYLTGGYMKSRLPYFVFRYPVSVLTEIFSALLLFCCLTPHILHRLQH